MSSNPPMVLVGFTFSPTEQQVINHLRLKNLGMDSELDPYIAEVDDILEFDPCELAAKSKLRSNKDEWWFLYRLFYRSSRSQSKNRKTKTGFWKVTGRGKKIEGSVGEKSYLTFYKGSCNSSQKTDYTMQEFYIPPHHHLHQDEFILVICSLKWKLVSRKRGRKSDKQKPTPLNSGSKKKRQKANAPHHEEGEPIFGNNIITSNIVNPIPSAAIPHVLGHGDVNHQPVSPMVYPDANFNYQTLSFMLDKDIQVPPVADGKVSEITTSDLGDPSASVDVSSLGYNDVSSQLYSPDSSQQTMSAVFGNAIQAPSGVEGKLSDLISDFAQVLGNEMQAPLGSAVISPMEYSHNEVNSQFLSPFSTSPNNEVQISSGTHVEPSERTTCDLQNPLAYGVISSPLHCDDDYASFQPVSQISSSSSVVIPVDHCYDNNSPIYSPHSNFMEQTWSSPFDKDMQTPSGVADELNEYYGKLPYLSVGHPPLGLGDIWSCPDLRHVQTEEVNKQSDYSRSVLQGIGDFSGGAWDCQALFLLKVKDLAADCLRSKKLQNTLFLFSVSERLKVANFGALELSKVLVRVSSPCGSRIYLHM
ncbi:hypothetical protein G4B88_013748 [Cannabis sativa]|uniref:NAC domain-containing protein n=1 Tax=Cannabis sativa TaxID=3483 RepID=A0A7J6I033_CANSA|nr:hypothetical protein G4B88_013748 [Cannabis sativa]